MANIEATILGHLLNQPKLLKNLDLDKNFFPTQIQRLVFKELRSGNVDAAIIINELKKKGIKDAAIQVSSLMDGIPKSKSENLLLLINKARQQKKKNELFQLIDEQRRIGLKTGDFDVTEEIRKGFEDLDRLDDNQESLEIETLKGLYLSDIPKRKTLINPIIGEKEIIVLSGLPKSGKSILALNLAFSLAKGKDWLNFSIIKPTRTIIFQQEISRESYKERISIMTPEENDLGFLDNISINKERGLVIDTTQGLMAISKAIESFKPEFVIIDPLASFHTKKENVAEEMGTLFKTFQALVDKFKITIFIIHHFSKINQEERHDVYMSRGSGVISASPDSVWTLKYLPKNKYQMEEDDIIKTIELAFEFRNTNRIKPLILKQNDQLWYEPIEPSLRSKVSPKDIVREIEKAEGEIYQSKLVKIFEGKASKGTIINAIKEAEELEQIDSSIIEGSRGKAKVLFLRESLRGGD